jgi:RNA polymerase subunit RPABC4/transcription elongation factor Spt4
MEKIHIRGYVYMEEKLTSDKRWTNCKTCEKQIAVSAKICPHCGARRGRSRVWKWVGGGFATLVVVAAIAGPQKPKVQATGTSGQQASVKASEADAAIAQLPEKQNKFISVITDYKARFEAAGNELQESASRDQRRTSILGVLGSQMGAEAWTGTLRKLETNTEGKAIITVRVAPDLDVLTWNNALTDSLYSTMIEKSSPVYETLMNMSVGDKVKFSGNFIRAEEDGILEGSMTIKGAMTAPEFLFQFTKISKN